MTSMVMLAIAIYLLTGTIVLSVLIARKEGYLNLSTFMLCAITSFGWPIYMWLILDDVYLWRRKR